MILKLTASILLSLFLVAGCGLGDANLAKQYNEFGIKCARAGLWEEAIMRWNRVIELNPHNAEAYNNLAVAYEAKGDLKTAKTDYEMAMKLDPHNKVYVSNYLKFKRNYERNSKRAKKDNSTAK